MNEKFAAFIAPAKKQPDIWMFLLAMLFLFIVYFVLMMLTIATQAFSLVGGDFTKIDQGFGTVGLLIESPDLPQWMLMVLSTFIAMFAAVWIIELMFRGAGLRSLIGPGPVLRYFVRAALVIFALGGLGVVFSFAVHDPQPNLAFSSWILWMLPALPLLFIQISAEELIFRGYILQHLAARFQNRLIWFVLPAVLFGMLHYSPDSFGANAWLVVVTTTVMGLITADLTVRTGNLGAALGLHFANNFIAMMVLSLDGTLNGLSLYVTDIHVTDTAIVRNLLLLDLALIIVAYFIFLWVIRLKQRG